jgi:hypothetical protein
VGVQTKQQDGLIIPEEESVCAMNNWERFTLVNSFNGTHSWLNLKWCSEVSESSFGWLRPESFWLIHDVLFMSS